MDNRDHFSINVSVAVVHDGKVLLCERPVDDQYFPGHWCLPGGKVEPTDNSIEAVAIREVCE